MIDVVLLIGRLLFVALLYLFLFALMKTGIGLVRGQRKKERTWNLSVFGRRVAVQHSALNHTERLLQWQMIQDGGADIVVGAGYVSGRHARFSLMGQNLFVEDLGSTNGTAVNGQVIGEPVALKNGDVVNVGDVAIRVRYE